MSLPRFHVEVSGGPAAANDPDQPDRLLTVDVMGASGAGGRAPYPIGSTKVEVAGRSLWVPFVPTTMRQAHNPRLDALCAGDKAALRTLLGRLARQRPKGNDVLLYGRWLFECLLAPAWPALCRDPEVVAAGGVELALMWDARHADLHSLVWEAMIDDQDRPLAGLLDMLVVVTRVVPVSYPAPATIEHAPRVLFASGASLTDEVIRPGAMFMGLLRKFDAEGICVSRAATDVSVSDLQAHCRAFAPDVVHLVAHGQTRPDGSGVLVLGSQNAHSPVGAGQLLTALTAGGVPMAAVLSACHTGGGPVTPGPDDSEDAEDAGDADDKPVSWRAAPLAAELVTGGIPIVTAMAGAVSEPACRMYTTRLVDAIHDGEPLGEAAARGRAAALAIEPAPFDHLDWAMPTIFLASSVRPDFRPLNPAAADWIAGKADALNLRKEPVFIGRQKILTALDDLIPAGGGRPPGCVAIYSKERLDGLGSTRLLEEIGFRLLRAGHVPLLLVNFSDAGFGRFAPVVPGSLRAFVFEVLQQAVDTAAKFGLRPPRLRSLAADPRLAGHVAVTGAGLADKEPRQAIWDARKALSDFRAEPDGTPRREWDALDPQLVKGPLADDLAELAGIMSLAGGPFGSHTRAVVLADRVHQWTGALDPLLAMVESSGLGTERSPVPLVVTASVGTTEGQRLQAFMDQRSIRVVPRYELTRLTAEEATLGFQWVLLSQWHHIERYRYVYVAARSTPYEKAREIFDELDGEPASVRRNLYQVVRSHVGGAFEEYNDVAAWEKWTERNR